MAPWLLNNLISLDIAINTITGGEAYETLSGRAHKARSKGHKYWGWTANVIDWLFFWDEGHCERVWRIENEISASRKYR